MRPATSTRPGRTGRFSSRSIRVTRKHRGNGSTKRASIATSRAPTPAATKPHWSKSLMPVCRRSPPGSGGRCHTNGVLRPPRQGRGLAIGCAIAGKGAQFQVNSLRRKHRVHPPHGLVIAEVVAHGGNVDQVNSILLTESIPVRVSVDDRLDCLVRPRQLKKSLDIQQVAVPIAQSVMDEDDRWPNVRFFQVASEPLSLCFSQKAGYFVHVSNESRRISRINGRSITRTYLPSTFCRLPDG